MVRHVNLIVGLVGLLMVGSGLALYRPWLALVSVGAFLLVASLWKYLRRA